MSIENIGLDLLKKELLGLEQSLSWEEIGIVLSVNNAIALINGMNSAKMGEKVLFASGATGVILGFDESVVEVMILNDAESIKAGDEVKSSNSRLNIPVGRGLLGRVIDPLGNPIDDLGPIQSEAFYEIERKAPGIMARESINRAINTGTTIVNTLFPIGRGQRELIIGDRKIGKTSTAIDMIINQKQFFDSGDVKNQIYCVYVAIGQETSAVARIVQKLRNNGAMSYTSVVFSASSDLPSLQFIAPYAGCSIAEYFRDNGMDALIVYDDLSKHSVAYRTVSLLLKRPPGREAFPGDVFYIHSRLLERAAQLSSDFGGGSLTAIPIIETQGGDVSGYVPTNVISITDGQLCFQADLFYGGIRPAIDPSISVSRIGSAAQIKVMKSLAGRAKLIMAQYAEMAHFAKLSSSIDETTKAIINNGERLVELFKQEENSPLTFAEQIIILVAGVNGLFNHIAASLVYDKMIRILSIIKNEYEDVIDSINKSSELTSEFELEIKNLLKQLI